MTDPIRILYVDDEDDIREVVEFALEDEPDFQVKLCRSGPEALASLNDERPDLILLDVMMPGMDGPAVLGKIRQAGIDAPVAFMTAKVQTSDIAHLTALGAVAVIAKPFDPMLLAGQIRSVLAATSNPARRD